VKVGLLGVACSTFDRFGANCCVFESLDLFNLLGTWCLTMMFDLRQRLGMSCKNLA
jgi:hypothetical protein